VFYERLAQREAMSALALRFIILTVSRSAEARLATWDELAADTWEIPGQRSKTRRPHRVPLAAEARRILTRAKGFDRHLVFPSNSTEETGRGKPLSINAFRPLYERMGYAGLTTHGFRSTFRDWCSEAAGADREVAEAALAHSVGQVERAYRRTDLFERRKDLMAQWSEYAASAVIQ
jgi:integrase